MNATAGLKIVQALLLFKYYPPHVHSINNPKFLM